MRLKFKPNVAAPRGTGSGSNADAGVAVRGGKTRGRRRSGLREKRLSGGDDSGTATGGESSSELETGETSANKSSRRRRVSSSSIAHKEVPNKSSIAKSQDTTSVSDISDSPTKDSSSQNPDSISHRTATLNTQPLESRTLQAVDEDKSLDLTPKMSATGGTLVRKPNSSNLSGGGQKNGGGLRMRKKVAPKVVSSRPRRAASAGTPQDSQLNATGQEQTSNETPVPSSQKSGATVLDNNSERTPPSAGRGTESSITPDTTPPSVTRTQRRTSCISKEQSTDEAISSTLNEVLCNTHSHPLADTGLSGIVQPQLNLFAGENVIPELQGDSDIHIGSDNVPILSSSSTSVPSQEREHQASATNKESQVAITSTAAVSEEDAMTTESNDRTSALQGELVKKSNLQVISGRTSRAGSESSQSRNSRSRTNSICSEVDGLDGSGQTTRKGGRKRRAAGAKRKKPGHDSTPCLEGVDDGLTTDSASSTPTKKARLSAAKVREAPNRTTMTMQELIYYNPTANPMSSTAEEKRRKKAEGEESRQTSKQGSRASSVQPQQESSTSVSETKQSDEDGSQDRNEDCGRIVPQLRIGDDGKIIVDESSVLMETTEQQPLEEVGDMSMFTRHTTSASYRRTYRVTKWSKEETGRFFKALSQVGTDFTMMTLLIPTRSRRELKNKFKKEEKTNPHMISQALKSQYSLQKLKEKK